MLARLFRWGGIGAVVLAVSSLISALVIDRGFGEEVLFIAPKSPEVVALDRELWEPGQPVAEIYGVPADRPARIVRTTSSRVIRPEEDRSLLLLQVDRASDDNPLQIKTVWFFTARLAVGLTVAGFLALGAAVWLVRRRARRGDRGPRAPDPVPT